MSIDTITLYRFSLPLIRPYKLALGDVVAFDTILSVIQDQDGKQGFGEATILTGYTPETIKDSLRIATGLAKRMAGLDAAEAKDIAATAHASAPFTSTAMVTAVEMLQGHSLLEVTETTHVPLLAIINATDKSGISEEIDARLAEGYGTLKVKVGFDADDDLARVGFIQERLDGRALIRLDGNQGYSTDDALGFAQGLNADGIELLEQPCHADDWDAASAVAKVSLVPMMLDESIYGPDDIDRAADLGAARFIKLKLMKAGGLDALASGLRKIRDRSMTPVLGNGVASDPGCWMEACLMRGLVDTAGEMNGFLKPQAGLFAAPLAVSKGALVLNPGMPRLMPADRLSALAIETTSYRAAA